MRQATITCHWARDIFITLHLILRPWRFCEPRRKPRQTIFLLPPILKAPGHQELPSLLSWRVPGPLGPHRRGRWSVAAHSPTSYGWEIMVEIQPVMKHKGELEPELLLDSETHPPPEAGMPPPLFASSEDGGSDSFFCMFWESNYNCYIDRAKHGIRFNLICRGFKSLGIISC